MDVALRRYMLDVNITSSSVMETLKSNDFLKALVVPLLSRGIRCRDLAFIVNCCHLDGSSS